MSFLRALLVLLAVAALPACASSEVADAVQPETHTYRVAAPGPSQWAPEPVISAPKRAFVVHFDFDSADIRASAMQIIYEASQVAGTVRPTTIRIHGFADGSGHKAYNQKLSERRAKAVADQFAKLGVKVAVEIKGFGKSKMKGASKDARRVEIALDGGDATLPAEAKARTITHAAAYSPATSEVPSNLSQIFPSVALQSVAKRAIKRDRVRVGTAWILPALSSLRTEPDGWPSGLRHRS